MYEYIIKKSIDFINYTKKIYPKGAIILPFLSFLTEKAHSQVLPAHNDTLTQSQVIVSVEPVLNAKIYTFCIFDTDTLVYTSAFPATFVNGLQFGKTYSWFAEVLTGSGTKRTATYVFHTARQTYSSPDKLRFPIIKQNDHPEDYRDGLVLLDYANVAINRKGEVVWFMKPPFTKKNEDMRSRIRPLMIGKEGNILFTGPRYAMECDLQGKLLWQAPEQVKEVPGNQLVYHHEIMRTSKGNYITLTSYRTRYLFSHISPDSVTVLHDVILEFSPDKRLLWMWRTGDHLSRQEIAGCFKKKMKASEKSMPVGEINSIYLDEEKDEVYIGLKDISNIIAVDHKSGRILCNYGDGLEHSPLTYAGGQFKNQHGGTLTAEGDLLVFDNNGENDADSFSRVIIVSGPGKKDPGNVVWSFDCVLDSLSEGKTGRMGYAQRLDNGNILVCMGFDARIFEVTPDKRVVWDCIPEEYVKTPGGWRIWPDYRAYYYPGLYPCAFTAQPYSDPGQTGIIIKNLGFNRDTYLVSVKQPGAKERPITTVPLEAGRETNVKTGRIKKSGVIIIRSRTSGKSCEIRF